MEVKGSQVLGLISAADLKAKLTFDLEACSTRRCHEAVGPEFQPDNSPLQKNHQMINCISKLKYNSARRPVNKGTVRHHELSLQMALGADWRPTKAPCMAEDLPAHIFLQTHHLS